MSHAETALRAVQQLHRRRPHSANGGQPTSRVFDFVAHGQTEFPDLCDHCNVHWPCETALAIENGEVDTTVYRFDMARMTVARCPACKTVKDVGHGPLCWDCYRKTATEGDQP